MLRFFLIVLLFTACTTAPKTQLTAEPEWECECIANVTGPQLPCGCGDIPAPRATK